MEQEAESVNEFIHQVSFQMSMEKVIYTKSMVVKLIVPKSL